MRSPLWVGGDGAEVQVVARLLAVTAQVGGGVGVKGVAAQGRRGLGTGRVTLGPGLGVLRFRVPKRARESVEAAPLGPLGLARPIVTAPLGLPMREIAGAVILFGRRCQVAPLFRALTCG